MIAINDPYKLIADLVRYLDELELFAECACIR